MRALYHRYCLEFGSDKNVQNDIKVEYIRQREFLERTVASLRRKITKDQEMHTAENGRIMSENLGLVKEVNQMRREFKASQERRKMLELQKFSFSKKHDGHSSHGSGSGSAESDSVSTKHSQLSDSLPQINAHHE